MSEQVRLYVCRRCGWPHIGDATCAEVLQEIADTAADACSEDCTACYTGEPDDEHTASSR